MFKYKNTSFGMIIVLLLATMSFKTITQIQAGNNGQNDFEDWHEREDRITEEQYEVIVYRQIDGTDLHIRGIRVGSVYYTETIDGYTIVLNDDGIYEYAELNSNGELIPGGLQASDPENRENADFRFLSNIEKNLRYQPPKLDEIENKEFHDFYKRHN